MHATAPSPADLTPPAALLCNPADPTRLVPRGTQVEVDAFCSVHDMLHAAIDEVGGRASLKVRGSGDDCAARSPGAAPPPPGPSAAALSAPCGCVNAMQGLPAACPAHEPP